MAHAIGLLGDRWSLVVIREALDGATRYDDFKSRLDMSDNTLSRKLRELVGAGLLERCTDRGRPQYRPTSAAVDLARVIALLGDWNQRWFPVDNPRRPPAAVSEAAEVLGLEIR